MHKKKKTKNQIYKGPRKSESGCFDWVEGGGCWQPAHYRHKKQTGNGDQKIAIHVKVPCILHHLFSVPHALALALEVAHLGLSHVVGVVG